MQLILIFLSVIMLLISVKCDESIKDLSDECSRGGRIFLPLTVGIGTSDTSVTMIASDGLFNCTLVYSVNSENYVMVVVQFPDWRPNEKVCNDDHNSVLMVSENFTENVCENFNNKSDSVYRKLGKGTLSVHIKNLKGMRTIKLTATSLKDPLDNTCFNEKEVECSYNSSLYCMTKLTKCDGHSNCGVILAYDENPKNCVAKVTITVVFYSVVTVIVLLGLFISMAVNIMPSNRRTFIQKMHEQTSLFDPSEDLISIDINIEVVLPSKLEEPVVKNLSKNANQPSKKNKKNA